MSGSASRWCSRPLCRSRSQTSASPHAPRRGHQPHGLHAGRLAARPTAWTSCTPCVPPAPQRGLLAARRAACYSRAPYQPCAGVRQARTRVCQCGGAMGAMGAMSSCSTRLATCPHHLKHLPRVCLPGTPLRAPATRPTTCRAPCCTARRIHQLHDLLTRRCPAASTSRAPRAAAHVLSASAAACSAPCRTLLRAPRHLPYRAALCCLPATLSCRLQADRRAVRLHVAELLHIFPRPSRPVFTVPDHSLL